MDNRISLCQWIFKKACLVTLFLLIQTDHKVQFHNPFTLSKLLPIPPLDSTYPPHQTQSLSSSFHPFSWFTWASIWATWPMGLLLTDQPTFHASLVFVCVCCCCCVHALILYFLCFPIWSSSDLRLQSDKRNTWFLWDLWNKFLRNGSFVSPEQKNERIKSWKKT